MSDGRRQLDDALAWSLGRARVVFAVLATAIAALIAVGVTLSVVEADEAAPVLPVQFRLLETELSRLPVRIDRLRSCACWHGPRTQSQRKYKFRVVNETDEVIDVGGGSRSVIRLIVAYPPGFRPRLTMPAAGTAHTVTQLGSPPDVLTPITAEIEVVRPSRIRDSNELFGVPPDHTLWALPSSPNKLAELLDVALDAGDASYPTVVDRPRLLPGEVYEGAELGHGTWTFYIPLPPSFPFDAIAGSAEILLKRERYERHVSFVGIAAMRVGSDGDVHLLGFAPAPSDAALFSPSAL